ncbi:MAG: hypothetical protein CMD04_05145 [Flavobacteriales bacterium]|nr:hypothetical protein [Flavobacteriales bacterium]
MASKVFKKIKINKKILVLFLMPLIIKPIYLTEPILASKTNQKVSFLVPKTKKTILKKVKNLKQKAKIEEQKGNYQGAINIYKDIKKITSSLVEPASRVIFEKIFSSSSTSNYLPKNDAKLLYGLIDRDLGRLYVLLGDYKEAEKLIENYYFLAKEFRGENHEETLIALNRLSEIYIKTGKFDEAKSLLKELISKNKNKYGRGDKRTATAINNLAVLYLKLGENKKAEELLQKTFEIDKHNVDTNHLDFAITYNNLGIYYYNIGSVEEAESYFLKALSIYEKNKISNLNIAQIYSNLAGLYESQFFYNKAEIYNQKGLKIRKDLLGNDHPDVASSLITLGILNMKQGQYLESKENLVKALDIFDEAIGKESLESGNVLHNLGVLFGNIQLYKESVEAYSRAFYINSKLLGKDHPTTAANMVGLALSEMRLGNYEKSEELNLYALEITTKTYGASHPQTSVIINNLGWLYTLKGEYNKAEKYYKEVLKINNKNFNDLNPNNAMTLNNLGWLYVLKEEDKKAKKILKDGFKNSIKFLQKEAPFLPISKRNSFIYSFGTFGNSYQSSFSWALDNPDGLEFAFFSRINRQGILQDIEKFQSQISSLPGPHKEILEKIKLINQKIASSQISNKKSLYDSRSKLEKDLYQLIPSIKPKTVEINEIANLLKKDSLLIEFQKYLPVNINKTEMLNQKINSTPNYLAMILKPSGEIQVINLGSADIIDSKIKNSLLATENIDPNAEEYWRDLSNIIISPLEEIIREYKTIIISQDGELNRVAFAALNAPKSNKLFSEKFELNFVTTGREIIEINKNNKKQNKSSLVIANPKFTLKKKITNKINEESYFDKNRQKRAIDLNKTDWEELPATEKEGNTIAKLIKAKLLTKEEATSLAVKNNPKPKILHIASHSFFLKDQDKNPLLRSGIVLAGANNKFDDAIDNGYLTALEVSRLDWEDTELVVISGCESGLGSIKSGEGVYGLKRAIAVAGARSSLLSLWEVDDKATAEFMESFYKKIIKGIGRAEALSNVQSEFRNHSTAAWNHPYYWAGFQLNGDPGPINWN